MLLRCFQTNLGKSIRLICSKIFNFSLVTVIALSLLNLMIHYCLMFSPIVSTFISKIDIIRGTCSLIMRVILISLRNIRFSCLGWCRNSLWMISLIWVKIYLLWSLVYIVVCSNFPDNFSHIRLIGKSLENVSDSVQLTIVRVIIPW